MSNRKATNGFAYVGRLHGKRKAKKSKKRAKTIPPTHTLPAMPSLVQDAEDGHSGLKEKLPIAGQETADVQ
ncbi:hypothetical protein [Bradyrhizobium sp. 197]|uniref:hypothetical protein n=1 Tax=Bradyrhizobium sp. 197 TaxID=2782663 RepID=UPI001FF90D4B|nr:hypothetical protein [Bradyrhizobium sp. 197]